MAIAPLSLDVAPVPTGCCPPFDPSEWNDREISWKDHLFVKEHVRTLFHVPLGMGATIVRAKARIDAAHAEPAHPLMLADDTSAFGTDLYIDVTGPVPGATMATLSGTYVTHVYDGPFSRMGDWAKDMLARVASQGRPVEHLYFAYTTCPRCAEAYGHNYVVAFARVAGAPPAVH